MPDEPITTDCNCVSVMTLATATTYTTHASTDTTATIQDIRVAEPLSVSSGITSVVVGGIIGGIITILLLVAVVLLTMTLIQLRKRKQHTISRLSDQNAIYDACPNPAYGGKFYANLVECAK